MLNRLSITIRAGVLLALLALTLVGCSPFNQTSGNQSGSRTTQGAVLGQIVTAAGIGQRNAPVNATDSFTTSQDRIYAVAEAQRIDSGTSMFARWSRDGRPFEDSQPVTANQTYQNTYV